MRVLAVLALAAMAGGMLFFAAITTPVIFAKLPAADSGPLVRAMFPFYYAYALGFALLSLLGLALSGQRVAAATLGVVALVVGWSWFWQLPALDALRQAGDMAAFSRGHRLSVWLFAGEWLAVLGVLVKLVK